MIEIVLPFSPHNNEEPLSVYLLTNVHDNEKRLRICRTRIGITFASAPKVQVPNSYLYKYILRIQNKRRKNSTLTKGQGNIFLLLNKIGTRGKKKVGSKDRVVHPERFGSDPGPALNQGKQAWYRRGTGKKLTNFKSVSF